CPCAFPHGTEHLPEIAEFGSRHGAMTPRGLMSTPCRRPRGRESHPGRSHYMLTSLFRRVVIVLGSLLATLPSLYGAALAQPFLDDSVSVAIDRMSQAAGAPVQTRRSPVSDRVGFMSTRSAPISVPAASGASAPAPARPFLRAHAEGFVLRGVCACPHGRAFEPAPVRAAHSAR